MRHPFFDGVSFEDVEALRVPVPWRPAPRCPSDTSNFERLPEGTDPPEHLREEHQRLFADF